MLTTKQEKRLAKIQEDLDGGAVQPNELKDVIRFIMTALKEVKGYFDFKIKNLKSESDSSVKDLSYSLGELELQIKNLVNGSEKTSLKKIRELSALLSYEIKRIEDNMPVMQDLSSIESKLLLLESKIPALPEPVTLDNPQQIVEKINTLHGVIKPEVIIGWEDMQNKVRNKVPENFDVRIGVSKTEIKRLTDRVAVLEATPGGTVTGSGYQAPLTGGLTGTNTWTTAPNVLVIDGVPRQKVQTDGTVMWTGTTTTTLTNAPLPTYDIYASA